MGEIYRRLAPLGVESRLFGREVSERGHTPTSAPSPQFVQMLALLAERGTVRPREWQAAGIKWGTTRWIADRMLAMGVVTQTIEELVPKYGIRKRRLPVYTITALGRELAAELDREQRLAERPADEDGSSE